MTSRRRDQKSDAPPRFNAENPALRYAEPVLAYSDMCKQLELRWPLPFAPKELIRRMEAYCWEQTFLKLARVAALMANSSDGLHGTEVRAWTTDLMQRHLDSTVADEQVVAFYVGLNSPRVIANEEVVYLLQSMAVLYGSETGPAPSDAQLAFWMLIGNDYCFNWRAESDDLPAIEELAATSARSLLFNHARDHLPPMVRAVAIFESTPPRTPEWRNGADWLAFQNRAFGVPLETYFDFLAGALYVISVGWGTELEGEGLRNPVIDPEQWIAGTGVPRDLAERFFQLAVASRAELRAMVEPLLDENGLPLGSMAFYLKPFVRFANGQIVAASPWVVREQIRGGVWAALLEQAKAEYGNRGGANRWLAAFGDIFELWCRDVARMAAASPTFRGTLLLSEQIGDADEIEDVVVVDEGRVMLASAKARMVRQELLKGALSAAEVLAWFDSFLFGKPSGDQRGGALRLLDHNVARVRAGAHVERGLTADCPILPILVTFDNLGADNLPLHIWLTERCRAEGLLQQPGVAPVLILHVEKFELLMAFAAAGRDMFEIFLDRDPAQRADIALFDASEGLDSTRLPGLEQRYQAIVERLQDRLATALNANAAAATTVEGR